MNERAIRTAEHFGQLERCKEFEAALLAIKDVVPEQSCEGVDFDLDGWWSNIRYLIIVPKYSILVSAQDYFERRSIMLRSIIKTAQRFGLSRTEDRIEDYGEHYYIVFRCDGTWSIKETR